MWRSREEIFMCWQCCLVYSQFFSEICWWHWGNAKKTEKYLSWFINTLDICQKQSEMKWLYLCHASLWYIHIIFCLYTFIKMGWYKMIYFTSFVSFCLCLSHNSSWAYIFNHAWCRNSLWRPLLKVITKKLPSFGVAGGKGGKVWEGVKGEGICFNHSKPHISIWCYIAAESRVNTSRL